MTARTGVPLPLRPTLWSASRASTRPGVGIGSRWASHIAASVGAQCGCTRSFIGDARCCMGAGCIIRPVPRHPPWINCHRSPTVRHNYCGQRGATHRENNYRSNGWVGARVHQRSDRNNLLYRLGRQHGCLVIGHHEVKCRRCPSATSTRSILPVSRSTQTSVVTLFVLTMASFSPARLPPTLGRRAR